MARTSPISKVKETLKGSVSTARDKVEAISPVGLPKRGSAARTKAPAPEPLEPQQGSRKAHGDALTDGMPAKKTPAKKAAAKKTTAKKTTAKKSTPAKKTTTKKAAAKKS